MRNNWDEIINEEKEGDIFLRNSCSTKAPYTNWLKLEIGTFREDG